MNEAYEPYFISNSFSAISPETCNWNQAPIFPNTQTKEKLAKREGTAPVLEIPKRMETTIGVWVI